MSAFTPNTSCRTTTAGAGKLFGRAIYLSRDHRTVYFTSDRLLPVHFPLTPEQAQQNFKQLESSGWFAGYAKVWSLSLAPWLKADDPEKSGTTR
jgi:hypothetical protein